MSCAKKLCGAEYLLAKAFENLHPPVFCGTPSCGYMFTHVSNHAVLITVVVTNQRSIAVVIFLCRLFRAPNDVTSCLTCEYRVRVDRFGEFPFVANHGARTSVRNGNILGYSNKQSTCVRAYSVNVVHSVSTSLV